MNDSALVANRYQLKTILGQGGMGTTYAAFDLATDQTVAIKVITFGRLQDWKILDLFEREAQVLAQLDHPAIPQYLDYFHTDSDQGHTFYLVQQLAPGQSLQACIDQGWRTAEPELKDLATQLLEILQYLHSQDPPIIHRDIKPHNIIRSDSGQIALVDFGSVRHSYYTTMARGSTVVGTYGYMAPEQFRGYAEPATDLYGLGATLLYVLVRRPPNDMPHNGLQLDLRSQVQLSEHWISWFEKMLAPELEDRFTSADEALISLITPQVKAQRQLPQIQWQPWMVWCAVGIIVTVGSLGFFRSHQWGILSRLGISPMGLCHDYRRGTIPRYLQTIEIYIKQGGIINPQICPPSYLVRLGFTEEVLQQGFDPNYQGHSGQTLLFAVKDLEQAQILIDHGADVNHRSYHGETPLHIAVFAGRRAVVKLLLEHGADVNAQDNFNRTPLFPPISRCCFHDQLDIIQLLIQHGADLNHQDLVGNTPLHELSHRASFEIIETLVSQGADIKLENHAGYTALTESASPYLTQRLIDLGADVNYQTLKGETPLLRAMRLNPDKAIQMAQILIENGADINHQDHKGDTALIKAIRLNHIQVVEMLLDQGANVNLVN